MSRAGREGTTGDGPGELLSWGLGLIGSCAAALVWFGVGAPTAPGLLATACGFFLLAHRQRDRGRPETDIEDRSDRQGKRILAVSRVTRLLGSEMETDRFLQGVTRIALEAFDCDVVSLLLLETESNELVVRAASGERAEHLLGTRREIGAGIAGKVALDGKPVILGKEFDRDSFRDLRLREPISASMIVPIHLREELVGVMCITSHAPRHHYGHGDLAALEVFADTVAVCLRHAEQAHWMRSTIDNLESSLQARRAG